MTTLEQEIGSMRARIENLHLDMIELREEVKSLAAQVSMGRGAIKLIGITGSLAVALTAFATWIGQMLKPF